MTRGEAVNWLINIMADIGKAEHRELWHYEQALSEIREMLQSEPERKTGNWIIEPHAVKGMYNHRCSACMSIVMTAPTSRPKYKYCPTCGARMEVEHETD